MKVKIISGTYGWKPDKDGSVEPVSKGSTCDVSDAEAARLVKLGVASYVEPPAKSTAKAPNTPPGGEEPSIPSQDATGEKLPANGGEDDSDAEEAAKLERMQKADLEQMAMDMGLDISGLKTKHDLAVLIVAAGEPEDGDVPPYLSAGNIVE